MAIEQTPGVTVTNVLADDEGSRYVTLPNSETLRFPYQRGYTVTMVMDSHYMDPFRTWQDVALTAAARHLCDPTYYYSTRIVTQPDWLLKSHGRPVMLYRAADADGVNEVIVCEVIFRYKFDPDGAKARDEYDADRLTY
jgi:hypothetical protein